MSSVTTFKDYNDEEINLIAENLKVMYLIREGMDVEELFEQAELDNDKMLTEAKILSAVKSGFKAIPVGKRKGLLGYFKSIATGVAKLFMAGIKGDTQGMKDILMTIKKEDVVDFIIKLDKVTLHMLEHIVDTIDTITGWKLKSILEDVDNMKKIGSLKIQKAIALIKKELIKVFQDPKKVVKHLKLITKLEHSVIVEK